MVKLTPSKSDAVKCEEDIYLALEKYENIELGRTDKINMFFTILFYSMKPFMLVMFLLLISSIGLIYNDGIDVVSGTLILFIVVFIFKALKHSVVTLEDLLVEE